MSSCLAAMYGTPRVLQSIANENVIPVIQILGRGVSLIQGLKLLSFSSCLIFVNSTALKEFQYRSLTWKEKLYFSNMICAMTFVHYNVSWKYGFVKLLTFLNFFTAEAHHAATYRKCHDCFVENFVAQTTHSAFLKWSSNKKIFLVKTYPFPWTSICHTWWHLLTEMWY
jgi:hypothetical protein